MFVPVPGTVFSFGRCDIKNLLIDTTRSVNQLYWERLGQKTYYFYSPGNRVPTFGTEGCRYPLPGPGGGAFDCNEAFYEQLRSSEVTAFQRGRQPRLTGTKTEPR